MLVALGVDLRGECLLALEPTSNHIVGRPAFAAQRPPEFQLMRPSVSAQTLLQCSKTLATVQRGVFFHTWLYLFRTGSCKRISQPQPSNRSPPSSNSPVRIGRMDTVSASTLPRCPEKTPGVRRTKARRGTPDITPVRANANSQHRRPEAR